jgi:hypothetical protein
MTRRILDCLWLWLLSIIAAFGIALTLGALMAAYARDVGQWEETDPAIRAWYSSLRQPDNSAISCCGESDAYYADSFQVVGDKFFAIITDTRPDEPLKRRHIEPGTRIEVPPHKIKADQGNPTGHFVIFIGTTDQVYCYVTGTLS